MKTFLCILDKKNEIDPGIHEKINSLAACFLSCNPCIYTSEMWQSPSKRIVLYSFTNEPLIEGNRTIYNNATDAITITGYVNCHPNEFSDKLLNRCFTESEQQKIVSRAGGLYSVCHVNGNKDIITVWNTITRIEPVYWVENNHYTIVSSRALIAHLLCEEKISPNYDIINLGYFINNGYYNSECTPYKNVKVLSPNSQLKISIHGLKVQPIDDTEKKAYLSNPDEKFYDELTDALLESLKPIRRHKVQISANLTGGKDSRLLVAALKYMDTDFITVTSGFPEDPEVVVANMVARALDIPHIIDIPKVCKLSDGEYLTHDIFKRTRDALFISDGMVSAYDNTTRYNRFLPDKVKVGGHAGELLKGGYSRSMTSYSAKNIKRFFENKFLRYASFMHDEPLRLYREDLNKWLDAQPNWITAKDLGLKFYLYYRCGRWCASARAGFTSGYYFYEPYLDAILAKIVMQIPCSHGVNDELQYNLLKRLAPKLIDIPFKNQRWGFESNGPLPGEENSWKKRTPITGAPKTKATFNWRLTCLTDMKEAFYEQILNSSSSKDLFQIVKREAIKELFDSPPQAKDEKKINLFLWNLYSASILVSNEWLNETSRHEMVALKVPK